MNDKEYENLDNLTVEEIITLWETKRSDSRKKATISGFLICSIIGLPFAIYIFIKAYKDEQYYKRIKKDCTIKSVDGNNKEKYQKITEYIKANKKWFDYF